MNFLYCFDENYNKQAFTSIISLLDNVHEKINIFVIHNKKLINNEIPNKVLNHQNLNMINLYEFNNREYFFPCHLLQASSNFFTSGPFVKRSLVHKNLVSANFSCNPIEFFCKGQE